MESNTFTGYFTSTGAATFLTLPPSINYIWVYNYTQITANANVGVQYYWQYGVPNGSGFVLTRAATGSNWSTLAVGSGFIQMNNSEVVLGPANALTAITAANPPVVTTAVTLPAVGSIVRFSNLDNQRQLDAIDFTVTAAGGGTFTTGNINMAGSTASTAGSWRQVSSDPEFYPRQRTVTYVTASGLGTTPTGSTRIYTSVTHGYFVGQKVNLFFPGGSTVWGNFAQLNNVVGTITAINSARDGNEPNNGGVDNNFDVDIDTTGYGTWTSQVGGGTQFYLPNASYPQYFATVVPFGENTSYAQSLTPPANVLLDSLDNVSANGILLTGGAGFPGGANGDRMVWVAGMSFDGIPSIPSSTSA